MENMSFLSNVLCLKCKTHTPTNLTYVSEQKVYKVYSGECTICRNTANMFFTPKEFEKLKGGT